MYWQQHSWNRLPANHPQAINCSASEGYVSYQIAGETTYETSFDAALGAPAIRPPCAGNKANGPSHNLCNALRQSAWGIKSRLKTAAPTTLAPAPTDCHGTNAIGSKSCRRIGKAASHPRDVPRPDNWLHCSATSKISRPRPMFHCRTSRNTPKKFPRPAIGPLDNWLHEHISDTWISHHLSKAHSQKFLEDHEDNLSSGCIAAHEEQNRNESGLATSLVPSEPKKASPYA